MLSVSLFFYIFFYFILYCCSLVEVFVLCIWFVLFFFFLLFLFCRCFLEGGVSGSMCPERLLEFSWWVGVGSEFIKIRFTMTICQMTTGPHLWLGIEVGGGGGGSKLTCHRTNGVSISSSFVTLLKQIDGMYNVLLINKNLLFVDKSLAIRHIQLT